jgi:hypothetical protein
MKITVTPAHDGTITVPRNAEWPRIVFRSDFRGPHEWHWALSWKWFDKNGVAATPDGVWDATEALRDMGGTLTVAVLGRSLAQGGKATGFEKAAITVEIRGENPEPDEVDREIARSIEADGFEKIVAQESRYKHFDVNGEPIKSFDNGFGLCQLTDPVPQFREIWSWKRNLGAGIRLFRAKRAEAIAYLGQDKRSYTAAQLKRETVARWNGGAYHTWNGKEWVRNGNILCDSRTGNMGWDMTLDDNRGKSESELRKRDKGEYAGGRKRGAKWNYFGVCYADHLLD